jgi:hypothetical protein
VRAAVLLSFLLSFSLAAGAASFDCSKARSYSEKLICSDPELSKLDEDLGTVYRAAKGRTGNSKEFRAFAKENWLKREACRTPECVRTWFFNSRVTYKVIACGDPQEVLGPSFGAPGRAPAAASQRGEEVAQSIVDETLRQRAEKAAAAKPAVSPCSFEDSLVRPDCRPQRGMLYRLNGALTVIQSIRGGVLAVYPKLSKNAFFILTQEEYADFDFIKPAFLRFSGFFTYQTVKGETVKVRRYEAVNEP